ncbi:MULTISPECIES: TetR/AcrR family transcriptional regulator [unclassified Nocardia]|uniref:TetR/AcrR family transcriptional regulator n=1 Tax=unclassified Nocardia TaxID=2637762 RepID=UPI003647839E
MSEIQDKPQGRQAQRLHTRKRVLDAAVAEFGRAGAAEADIATIVEDAGVARGTFYFHFPTKEHVLLELEQREEKRIAGELGRYLRTPHDLAGVLAKVVRLVAALERRLGSKLFKDLLAVHFSPTRPLDDTWREHSVIALVAQEIEQAAERGEAQLVVESYHSAVFFLIGLYALLTSTSGSKALRTAVLADYVTTTLRSLEPR